MKHSYSLRQVVDLTGLSEFTLRGWETRYAAFVPRRTSTGRRRYSAGDLRKAMLLRDLLKRDQRIGDIAHLTVKKLGALMDESTAGEVDTDSPPPPSIAEQVIKLASVQKWDEVELLLEKHRGKSPREIVHSMIIPVLGSLAQAVETGLMTIAQEHILSALLKEQLYHLRSRAPAPKSRRRVLVASPEGDHHEIGILLAHVLASLHGLHSLFVGPNTPKNELAETATLFGATHIILGSTISRREGAKEELGAFVHFLDKNLPPQVALWIGGRNTMGFKAQLSRPHQIFRSLQELEKGILLSGISL